MTHPVSFTAPACHYLDENWLMRGPDMPLRGFA